MPLPLRRLTVVLLAALALPTAARAEDGYELWLRYVLVSDATRLAQYRAAVTGVMVAGDSPPVQAARDELTRGLRGLLGTEVPRVPDARDGVIVAGTPATSPAPAGRTWPIARSGRRERSECRSRPRRPRR